MKIPFLKKNKDSKSKEMSDGEKYIHDSLNLGGDAAERALIAYVLLQSKTNDISLAQKNDATYINFRGEKIQNFLRDWYSILTLRQHNKISERIYQTFIDAQFEDEKIEEEKKQEENKEIEFDDYSDIL